MILEDEHRIIGVIGGMLGTIASFRQLYTCSLRSMTPADALMVLDIASPFLSIPINQTKAYAECVKYPAGSCLLS